MALEPGSHALGPESGSLHVRTYREGVAQKIGHDLVIEVTGWEASVEVGPDGAPTAVGLEADPQSLEVREGRRGVKPLSDRDREEIRKNIDQKILGREAIAFRSTEVTAGEGRLEVSGELSLAGATRPTRFELELAGDARASGTLSITQSDWGIKPYRGLMGALKVRDDVEVVLDARLPTA